MPQNTITSDNFTKPSILNSMSKLSLSNELLDYSNISKVPSTNDFLTSPSIVPSTSPINSPYPSNSYYNQPSPSPSYSISRYPEKNNSESMIYSPNDSSDFKKLKGKKPFKINGLNSRKLIHPILTASEFLGDAEKVSAKNLNSSQKNIILSQKILGIKTRRSKR